MRVTVHQMQNSCFIFSVTSSPTSPILRNENSLKSNAVRGCSTSSAVLPEIVLFHTQCYQRQFYFIQSAVRSSRSSSSSSRHNALRDSSTFIILSQSVLLYTQCYQGQFYFFYNTIRGNYTSSTVLSDVVLHQRCYQR